MLTHSIRSETLRCHAVHVALCLYESGLLLLPSSFQSKLLTKDDSDPPPLRRLNFATLIMMFTRKFEGSDPQEALQYFYFLRDIKVGSGKPRFSARDAKFLKICVGDENLFMSCVSTLVRESREFGTLLGRREPQTGQRKPGAIDKVFDDGFILRKLPDKTFISQFCGDTTKLIRKVASDCEDKGLFEDAVRLYDLGGCCEKVVALLSQLLSQILADADKPQSDRNRLKVQGND